MPKRPSKQSTTLYEQVQASIADMIKSHRLSPGQALPSEKELEEQYGVSRITVRRALEELERDGKVVRSKGRAARVAETIQAHAQTRLADDMMAMLDLVRDTVPEIIRFEWILPDDEICAKMEQETREPVLCVERVRKSHGRPTLFTSAIVPAEVGLSLDRDRLARGTMLEQISQLGLIPVQVDQFMAAIACTGDIANHLQAQEGDPMFQIHRIVRDDSGRVIQLLTITLRGDSFTYHLAARFVEQTHDVRMASNVILKPAEAA